MKETQGSVETTSYGQMTNILKYGTYRVGFKRNAQTVPDLITVMLTQRRQKLFKSKYTLDELRDLESKLVLICGNKSDTRAEVDHYLNVCELIYIATVCLLDMLACTYMYLFLPIPEFFFNFVCSFSIVLPG